MVQKRRGGRLRRAGAEGRRHDLTVISFSSQSTHLPPTFPHPTTAAAAFRRTNISIMFMKRALAIVAVAAMAASGLAQEVEPREVSERAR